jgi:hypothetical protein
VSPDQINGLFELFGSVFILNHCRAVLRDKAVAGVSIVSAVFFTAWGVWNLWYYPSLGQWYSFAGGVCIVLANVLWVGLMARYGALRLPVVRRIPLDPPNRMLRAGGGRHHGKPFFRVDLWWFGVRFA